MAYEKRLLQFAGDDGVLDLGDGLGDVDLAGAGLGAVVGGAAAPQTVGLTEHLHALRGPLIAAVEDEAVGVHDGGGAEVAAVGPEDRAALPALRRGWRDDAC